MNKKDQMWLLRQDLLFMLHDNICSENEGKALISQIDEDAISEVIDQIKKINLIHPTENTPCFQNINLRLIYALLGQEIDRINEIEDEEFDD